VRPTDQGVGADTDTQRRTATAADIFAGKRAVVQAGRRCEHAPRHYAASFYTEVEPQPVNVTNVVFRRNCAIFGNCRPNRPAASLVVARDRCV